MSSSPSSGLSAEAKEFVPLVPMPSSSIPLYVDENTVASIYPSDQAPFMIQTIYPMMISNTKMIDVSTNNLPFPEIEFHIQPSQQQQFHIDSCSNLGQSSSNSAPTTPSTSQIVLLPTTATASAVTPTGYYPTPQIIYSPNEPVANYYPMDYCEQPLINFSLQQPNILNKSNRISSRLPRPTSFRSQHGNNSSSYRTATHHTTSYSNRNSYYDYHPRRNGTTPYSTRGNSANGKRISSSYHQQDYNHYYPHSSSRARGYSARSSQYHDEQRKDPAEYYNQGKDFYETDYQQSTEITEDETQFEFRPEDFPSLPINQQSDKTPSQTAPPTITRSASSWNAIVSAPRPHSTSPHSVAPSSLVQSQDQRSDRSRSFNNTTKHPLTTSNHTKKSLRSTTTTTIKKSKSPPSASKSSPNDEIPTLSSKSSATKLENDSTDDGFMQTKHQQRRLKRKNRMKETDDHRSVSPSIEEKNFNQTSENNSSELIEKVHRIDLNDRLSSTTMAHLGKDKSDKQTSAIPSITHDKSKSSINLQNEANDIDYQTDRTADNRTENEDDQNSALFSSSTTNSSDTSDYDDAVDNLAEE